MEILKYEEYLKQTQGLMVLGSSAASLAGIFVAQNQRKLKRWWVRPIYSNRLKQGDYHNLMAEMRLYDTEMFFHYTRLTIPQFDELLSLVGPLITKRSNRTPLNPEHRLAITLRFLATGSTFQTLAFQFRVGKTTVCNVVHETCDAIWMALNEKVFAKPTQENWLRIADEFEQRWNLPHCLGALDGKDVRIQAPPITGSEFFNNKQFFSILLLAMCDANYKFIYVDIRSTGSKSDGGAFAKSSLGKMLEAKKLNLPNPSKIGNYANCIFPYFFVGDEAFPLKQNIMRPYPGKSISKIQAIYNYRISRARRTIENTFGILVSRWRIFQGPIVGLVENVDKYIQAAVCLHNYLKKWEENSTQPAVYCPSQYVDKEINGRLHLGGWRQNVYDCQLLQPTNRLSSNNASKKLFQTRTHLSNYFVTEEGAVPWQETYIARGSKRQIN